MEKIADTYSVSKNIALQLVLLWANNKCTFFQMQYKIHIHWEYIISVLCEKIDFQLHNILFLTISVSSFNH